MKPTLPLLPLLLAVIVLSGCPDSKMPKVPPKVPEPKALATASISRPALEMTLAAQLRLPR